MFEVSVIESASSRRRRLVVVLVLLLGLTGGVALGRTWTTPAAMPAGEPAPSSSSTTAPSASPSPSSSSTTTTGPAMCDQVKVRPFFAVKIGDSTHHPKLTTRHRALGDGLTGCRWEDAGKALSLVAGPAPIARPWAVIDDAWTTAAPWGCHEDGGDRCTSVMWGAGTGATRLTSWATGDGKRQCVIEAAGLDLDQPEGDYSLWELCAELLTGEPSRT